MKNNPNAAPHPDKKSTDSIKGKKKVYLRNNKMYVVSLISCSIAAFVLLFSSMDLLFSMLYLVTALMGSILLILLLTGYFIRHYLVFETEGIRIGTDESSHLVTWDNIQACSVNEVNNKSALCLVLFYPDNVMHSISSRMSNRMTLQKKIIRTIEHNELANGCHVLFFPELYGLDAHDTERAIQKYIEDTDARSELV